MLTSLFAIVALQAQYEPPRLQTQLPNRAIVLVERLPSASYVSVQLIVAARELRDAPGTHGLRHLTEHLWARGKDGRIDGELESVGCFLSAQTSREDMIFEISGPTQSLPKILPYFAGLLKGFRTTQERIAAECVTIGEEEALRDPTSLLISDAFQIATGGRQLDPFGDLQTMRNATPDLLLNRWKRMTRGENVAMVIAGNVDLDAATAMARPLLESLPLTAPVHPHTKTISIEMPSVQSLRATAGVALASQTSGFRERSTAARIAAGLAMASLSPGSFFVYTPSNLESVIVIGSETRDSGFLKRCRSADPAEMFTRAKSLAKSWITQKLDDPRAAATMRGRLIAQSPALRPETLLENLRLVTAAELAEAFKSFSIEVNP
jgi:predicted Zn-dependent peptidase